MLSREDEGPTRPAPHLTMRGRSITAAATAAVATAAATTTAVATAAATTAATAAIFPRLGFVHGQVPPVMVPIVEPLDGRLGLGVGAHLHEAEPLRAVRLAVDDDLGALHSAELGEQRFQVRLVDVVSQV